MHCKKNSAMLYTKFVVVKIITRGGLKTNMINNQDILTMWNDTFTKTFWNNDPPLSMLSGKE